MTTQAAFVWTKEFKQGFREFQRKTGKDLPEFMTEAMRHLVETLYHWTPPPTRGNRGSRGGRAGGKATVKDDIYQVAEGREKGYLDLLQKIYGTHVEHATWRKKDTGQQYTLRNVTIDPTGRDLQRRHFERRVRRGGVPGRGADDGSDVANKTLAKYSAVKRYVRDTQKRVGKLKDAWTPALRATGSKLPPRWVSVAGSLQGKSGTPSGSYDETQLKPQQWAGYLEATAKSEYMRDADGFVRRAHQYVEKNILGRRLQTFLDNAIKRYGDAA